MATNVYFNNFPTTQITGEQQLVEDLVIEALQMYGMDVYYLPRESRDSVDYLYGEDVLKTFKKAYPLEIYLENVTGMDGEQDFITKFGLEIRDEMTILVSRRRFKYATKSLNLVRPREGDLVYLPMMQNFFEITYVESENDQAMFYTLGRGRGGNVYLYALKLKQFVFSEEVISTGVSEIDDQIRDSYERTQLNLSYPVTYYSNDEIVYQSPDGTLANATAQAIVHSQSNTALYIYRRIGEFANGFVIGASSTSNNMVILVDDSTPLNNSFEDIIDNARIETESDGIIDFTEINPFGEP